MFTGVPVEGSGQGRIRRDAAPGRGLGSEDMKGSESENKVRRTNECNRFLRSGLHPFALWDSFSGIDVFTASQSSRLAESTIRAFSPSWTARLAGPWMCAAAYFPSLVRQ
jgi:hypothetical protein